MLIVLGTAENKSCRNAKEIEPEQNRHFREDSQEKLAGSTMLKHGWNKHIVAFLQVLA